MLVVNLKQKFKLIGDLSESDPLFAVTSSLRSRAAHHPDIPKGVFDAALESLFYAVLRHRPLVQAPLFGAVLKSFLSRHFGVPGSLAHHLVEDLLIHTAKIWPPFPLLVPPTDQEFLRYLVAHVTFSKDLETLVRDWGLGAEILVKLSNSLQIFDQSCAAKGSSTRVFLPELDAHISQIILDLALEQEEDPWAVHHWLIRFRLMEVREPWRQRLKDHGESWLLQVLVQIGLKGQASLKSIKKALEFQGTPDIPPEEVRWLLKTFDLAYPVAQSTQHSLWELSAYGRTLTRDVVSSRLLVEKRLSPLRDYISALYPEYQEALLCQYPFATSEELISLALHCRPLAPQALEVALERLSQMAGAEKAEEVAREIVQHDSSTWLRKTASKCRGTDDQAQKLTEA